MRNEHKKKDLRQLVDSSKDRSTPYYQALVELRFRLGRNIQYLREQHNMSQEDLAARLGTARTRISFAESGYRSLRLKSLVGLSSILGIPLDALLSVELSDRFKGSLQRIYGVNGWYSLPTRINKDGGRWHDTEHSGLEVEVEGIPGYCNKLALDAPAAIDFLVSFVDLGISEPEALANQTVIAYYYHTSLGGIQRRRY